MAEVNPPNCQIARDEYGDCPVAGCGTSVEYRPPDPVVVIIDPDSVVCDAARNILRGEG